MARDREKYVELYNPNGTKVEVAEDRAEVLKERGFTTSKPRQPRNLNATGRNTGGSDDGRLAELEKQLADAQRERDEALAKASEKK